MRNLVRIALFLLAAFISSALHAESASSLPAPSGYIDDYATVLSPVAKAEFEQLCIELHDKTKAQIFVVTVKTLDGASVDQFANDLFHKWKIGEKKTDRGVLLLFATTDHKWRIEVGYGLEPILNDAKVGDIGRAMVPDLHAAEWDDGIRTGLHSLAQIIADDSNVQLNSLQSEAAQTSVPQLVSQQSAKTSTYRSGWILATLFWIVWLAAIAFSIVRAIRKNGRSATGSSSDWGSTSGGSSFSDSGSSDSFGGGDGGDSGGGGASGDF